MPGFSPDLFTPLPHMGDSTGGQSIKGELMRGGGGEYTLCGPNFDRFCHKLKALQVTVIDPHFSDPIVVTLKCK